MVIRSEAVTSSGYGGIILSSGGGQPAAKRHSWLLMGGLRLAGYDYLRTRGQAIVVPPTGDEVNLELRLD